MRCSRVVVRGLRWSSRPLPVDPFWGIWVVCCEAGALLLRVGGGDEVLSQGCRMGPSGRGEGGAPLPKRNLASLQLRTQNIATKMKINIGK